MNNLKIEQPIAIKIIENMISKNKINHAFLVETNNYTNVDNFLVFFAQALICKDYFKENHDTNICDTCYKIENNVCEDLVIIEPESKFIKKEQLINLKKELETKSLSDRKRVYIIKEAEKMNQSSANTILKFLEEPEENIIAIMVTNNSKKILPTILSRCQILSLKNGSLRKNFSTVDEEMIYNILKFLSPNETEIELRLEDEEIKELIDKVFNLVIYYEKYKLETILHLESLIGVSELESRKLQEILKLMSLLYVDVINYLVKNKTEYFLIYEKEIGELFVLENINKIINKINILIDIEDKLKNNINKNLIFDKIFIEFEEVDNDRSSRN
jgi:DNA polymerase-3 subunit delta'